MRGAVQAFEGFHSIEIEKDVREFEVTYDPASCSPEELAAAIEAAGEKVSIQ